MTSGAGALAASGQTGLVLGLLARVRLVELVQLCEAQRLFKVVQRALRLGGLLVEQVV